MRGTLTAMWITPAGPASCGTMMTMHGGMGGSVVLGRELASGREFVLRKSSNYWIFNLNDFRRHICSEGLHPVFCTPGVPPT